MTNTDDVICACCHAGVQASLDKLQESRAKPSVEVEGDSSGVRLCSAASRPPPDDVETDDEGYPSGDDNNNYYDEYNDTAALQQICQSANLVADAMSTLMAQLTKGNDPMDSGSDTVASAGDSCPPNGIDSSAVDLGTMPMEVGIDFDFEAAGLFLFVMSYDRGCASPIFECNRVLPPVFEELDLCDALCAVEH